MQQKSLNLCFVISLLFVGAFPTFGADSQPFSEDALAKGMPDIIGSEWKAKTPSRKLNADKITDGPETKILIEYGLQSVTNRLYTNGKDNFTVEVFEMKYASGAYGLWTFHRPALPQGQKEFLVGRYLVRISASASAITEMVWDQIQNKLPPASDIPLLTTYLPEQNKLAGSEKYLVGPAAISQTQPISDLKEVIDFTGGTHAVVADYNNGDGKMSIILIEFQSPQFATDGLVKIRQHFNALSPEEQKKRIIRRVGNYAVEAVNVLDAKAAEELLGQIKYMARVHWEGKGMSAIPPQFRPPDPTSIREAIQTGQFIVAAFYWIGILVVGAVFTGVFAGGVFFYWRRAQRRRLGLRDSFSDAGGLTRLNLEDYLLTELHASQKFLGKKE